MAVQYEKHGKFVYSYKVFSSDISIMRFIMHIYFFHLVCATVKVTYDLLAYFHSPKEECAKHEEVKGEGLIFWEGVRDSST